MGKGDEHTWNVLLNGRGSSGKEPTVIPPAHFKGKRIGAER